MIGPRLSDVSTAATTVVWVLAARLVIARHGFAGAIRRYSFQPGGAGPVPAGPLTPGVRRAARIAQRVVRLPVLGATCLPRSIALARVVASHGTPAEIVLGVTRVDGFGAHAWVEAGGLRFDPSHFPEDAYQPTGRFTLAP